MHGQGTITWSNGVKYYAGEWKNNKMHGQGSYTSPDGKIIEGTFKNGKFLK